MIKSKAAKKATKKTVQKSRKKSAKVSIEAFDLTKEAFVHEVEPREVSGGSSGKRFEFQYERASNACLKLLQSDDTTCIFCEWHDDFVVERKVPGPQVLYSFNQVKTRDGNQGPWSIWDVFGVNKTKTTSVSNVKKSFISKLLRHFIDFGKNCDEIVFVTNGSLDVEFEKFWSDFKTKTKLKSLKPENKIIFEKLYKAYSPAYSSLLESDFYGFLKRLNVVSEDAPLEKSSLTLKAELIERILDLSEIDLNGSQATKISKELVGKVRDKSQKKISKIITEAQLRSEKGVEIHEILNLLSLSHQGYLALNSGQNKEVVKQLSRLGKLLKKAGIPDNQIKDFCNFKVRWDSWVRKLRHEESSSTHLFDLKSSCWELLKKWSSEQINRGQMLVECQVLAQNYHHHFSSLVKLDKNIVFGCVLAIAAEEA